MNEAIALKDLRTHFLQTSTQSMPIAGLIFWAIIGVAVYFVKPQLLVLFVLAGAGMIFPLAALIDKLRGKAKLRVANTSNPVVQLFMQSIFIVALIIPFVIIAYNLTKDVPLIVLGIAILTGIVWIPYGWGANDPVGLRHAAVRSVFCYLAYLFVPAPHKVSAICAVVVLAYVYSLMFMKKPA